MVNVAVAVAGLYSVRHGSKLLAFLPHCLHFFFAACWYGSLF